MKTLRIAALTACIACLLAIPAQAHVTVHPNVVPGGGFTVLDVRVPNERDKNTSKVDVKFPDGFIFVSYQPVAGWKAKVIKKKLAKPVTVFGEKQTEQVDRVVWTADGPGLAPGQFVEFPLSVAVPEKAKSPLTFPALQTYDGGEVVRWIGAPDADTPAPQVGVVGAKAAIADIPAGGATAGNAEAQAGPAPAKAASAGGGDSGPPDALVWAALALGALGLIAGLAGFSAARGVRRERVGA